MRKLPVIAMTASAFVEDIHKWEQVGMNGYLTKPIEISLLMKILDKYLKN